MNCRSIPCLLVAVLGLGLNSCGDEPTASSSTSGSSLSLEEVMEISRHAGRGNDRLRQMLDFAEGLGATEVEAAIDQVLANNPAGRNYDLLPMLYHRWCELDRHAALGHALKQEGNQQFASVGSVVGWWAARDADAAWEWFEREGHHLEMASPGQTILSAMARSDPEKAISLHRESEAYRRNSNSDSPAFLYGTWALDDPAAAAAHLDQEKNVSVRMSATNSILNAWNTSDPDAAWTWIQQRSRSEERLFALGVFFSQLTFGDFSRFEEFFGRLDSGYEREKALESVVSALSFRNPARAYEIAKRHSGGSIEDAGLLVSVFSSWAGREPEKAFQVARAEVPAGRNREMILAQIIQTASQGDTDLAVTMLEEVETEGDFGFAAGLIARNKAREDVGKALAWADSLPAGRLKQQATSEVFSEWAKEAPDEAAARAEERAKDDPDSNLTRQVLSGWASREPAAVITWAMENVEPDLRTSFVSGLIAPWAQKDLPGAVEWVAALSDDDDELKAACLGPLANAWADRDPEEAAAWLEELEPGGNRDQAISNYAGRVFHRDPELGMTWALKMEDERQRSGNFESMARRYLASQPEKARRWIEENQTIPAELKERLLAP